MPGWRRTAATGRIGWTTWSGISKKPRRSVVGGEEGLDAQLLQFPGHRFVLSAGPDAHNDVVRFSWTLNGADGPVAAGTDFATVAGDGRLQAVTGFLEQG
jgi:hypothetical protein